jgi:hypothetical protein
MTDTAAPQATPAAPSPLAPPPKRSRPAPGWLLWAVVLLLVWLVVRVDSLQAQNETLRGEVHDLATAVSGRPPQAVGEAALDLPPPDAEASRRAINEAYRAVFSSATPPEQWAGLVTAPGDLGQRLRRLSGGRCGTAVPVLESIRFTGDDDAQVGFRFVGVDLARGVPFSGGARRDGGVWKVTAQTLDEVVRLAESAC